MKLVRTLIAAAVALTAASAALADINVGVTLSLTGPGSGLGIPMQKQLTLFPKEIAGEKVNLIILDDASDPGKGVSNARRFITEDHVDLIFGSCITPVSAAIAPVAAENKTLQISAAPVGVPPADEHWVFRLPQGNDVMAHAVIEDMKKRGVKTIGFIGYTDAYGELWLKAMEPLVAKEGMKIVDVERFQRSDTSVTPQALKLASANPDAILVVASGSGAAMPEMAIVDRGYKGKIYQTHAAATPDLVRIGGKAVEGTYVVSGPAIVAEQLPDSHPSKKASIDFVTRFEKAFGPGSRNQFAGHSYDFAIVMEKIVPMALKKGKPGTPEFRTALRDSMETIGRTILAHGVMNWTPADHWGYTNETGVMLQVKDGKFVVVK
ncbi:ABC transporter substrate-binding protein [Ramlibacter ginsenosidimutans]|uniref:ABC transporter substrate-binding protein n=1 Tax=Ramlibacter ginsenosidimutans TaxID=502333 RepID=A0A934WPM9_9BURK|nr:ABC transporter substrate-binding protein [Ramlibacter ginsenosidimutans]MBK6008297.1 ABC transporter substrate-binding protein [Ramlibacter ginsenosidimutans]